MAGPEARAILQNSSDFLAEAKSDLKSIKSGGKDAVEGTKRLNKLIAKIDTQLGKDTSVPYLHRCDLERMRDEAAERLRQVKGLLGESPVKEELLKALERSGSPEAPVTLVTKCPKASIGKVSFICLT